MLHYNQAFLTPGELHVMNYVTPLCSHYSKYASTVGKCTNNAADVTCPVCLEILAHYVDDRLTHDHNPGNESKHMGRS